MVYGTGKGGNIEITTGFLSVPGGAQLLTNTVGRGLAGNIIIKAGDRVSFNGTTPSGRFPSAAFSSVDTTTNFTGKGGNITVDTNLLRVIDGASIDARTLNSSDAGNITINAGLVEVLNGGQIISTSSGSRRAGKITVNGTDAEFNERLDKFPARFTNFGSASGFFVLASSSGIAGDIEVTSPKITLDNKGRFIAEFFLRKWRQY
ncbi:MAG: hypothetical protein V7K90_01440 [Nostoc sp.]|uniref:hypothetical protein n=1 Tax=Nostoc sp. TaxID=1180 RepID=UPI002FFBE5EA